jgi:ComF family protein
MKTAQKLIPILSLSALSFSVYAQSGEDQKAIKEMCGCYSVTFDYAETFSQDTNYKLHDQYHASASAEWIFVDEETDDKIVIQHLLVINDTMIIKHWRQDWLFQNQDFFWFDGDRRWKYDQLSANGVSGQWTQKVYQVDDSPRYEGSASWVHVDGKRYWENTTDAPLPRREFSKRSDYNVMQRTNKHILTDYGWLHEQDNLKIERDGSKDQVIVAEKGLNAYTKIDNAKCEAGRVLKDGHFTDVDVVVPIPLHADKLKKRGFNQCDFIAAALARELDKSYNNRVVQRLRANETQTKKGRYERWINVKELFRVTEPQFVIGKHVLLIDDVVTTGSTLEACADAILQVPDTKVSVATLACPSPY